MNIGWKQVVRTAAPALASMFGTPLAGAVVGALSETLLGNPDGTEEEIAAVVAGGGPDVFAKITEAQRLLKVRLAEINVDLDKVAAQMMKSVNVTMREEAKSEHWVQYSWRPFWGFISGACFGVVCVFVCALAWRAVFGGRPDAIAMIPQLVGAFTALFAIPGAILGVAAWHRGVEKRIKAGDTLDSGK